MTNTTMSVNGSQASTLAQTYDMAVNVDAKKQQNLSPVEAPQGKVQLTKEMAALRLTDGPVLQHNPSVHQSTSQSDFNLLEELQRYGLDE